MAANFYVNVSNVAVGETAIDGVQSVSLQETSQALAKFGDGDPYPRAVRTTRRTITTIIVTDDINHGVSIGDARRRVSFTAHQGDDQAQSAALTAEGGVVISVVRNAGHNGKGQSTITLQHRAADGITNPVSVS